MVDATTTKAAKEDDDTGASTLSVHLQELREVLTGGIPGATASEHRGELTITVDPVTLTAALQFARDDAATQCELLSDISAVHWPGGVMPVDVEETTGWPTYTEERDEGSIEVNYILRSVAKNHWFRIRVSLPDDDPTVASATGIYSSANFMEREAYDLMGVEFTGHPNLTRIMMPDDWNGHPHRKDYPLGGVEVMYKGETIPPPDERDY
ncbi:NADH-quinone oxidoreductase subunit C [Euzebya tangerina]|uniref:NADH-quinone oxidoreductase subunit C n=1 Tax=Euzebya tangerina TaxID=591198 RepID=UPI000E3219D8|nr:NADH-quinone oxidoreductase subunit C [Euzebya tangerina]